MYSMSICLLIQFLHLITIIYAEDDIKNHKNFKLLPKDCGLSYTDRIIGGQRADLGQFPWLVRMGFVLPGCTKRTLYRCGGVLISDRYVITAAHCATDLPTITCPYKHINSTFVLARVNIGEYNTKTDPDCVDDVCAAPVQMFKIDDIIVHEKYNDPQYANDVALIRLEDAVELNGWASPICLPRGDQINKYYTNETAIVAGWGTTNISKPGSSHFPMFVKIPILEIDECLNSFAVKLVITKDQQLCAGGEEDKDSCGGDSGGPLMFVEAYDGPPRFYVIGTVSFGVKHCGRKGKPAIYTRVAGYTKWILDHMEP